MKCSLVRPIVAGKSCWKWRHNRVTGTLSHAVVEKKMAVAPNVFWEVISREIVGHLMDGVEQEHIGAAQEAATAVPRVLAVRVRGRWITRSLTLEVKGQGLRWFAAH